MIRVKGMNRRLSPAPTLPPLPAAGRAPRRRSGHTAPSSAFIYVRCSERVRLASVGGRPRPDYIEMKPPGLTETLVGVLTPSGSRIRAPQADRAHGAGGDPQQALQSD